MLIAKDQTNVPFKIQRYQPGEVVINEQIYRNSVIIYPDHLDSEWKTQQFAELSAEDFQQFCDCGSQLIIFGTGESQQFPDPALYSDALNQGVMFEFMNSKSACYTFNILQSENRDVVCALLL